MSEIWLEVGGRNVVTVRLEPNKVHGRDMAGQPALYLPFQLQLLPGGQNKNLDYAIVRLAGKVQNPHLGEFGSFDAGPLALIPNPDPFYRQQEAMVVLDPQRIKRFEDARSGRDAQLQLV